jgi:hypothetical protein
VINSPPRGIGKTTIDEIERRAADYELSWWETIAVIDRAAGESWFTCD